MKKLLKNLIFALFIASCFACKNTAPTAKSIFDYNKQLGKGINFGNALEAPNEGEWGITLEEKYFELVKQAGFNTIRLPIRWSAHTAATAPYTINADFFLRIDWCIGQASKRGLNIILNVHHYEDLDSKPAENLSRWLAIWEQIATRYKNESGKIFFELYNEPHAELNNLWNEYLRKGINAIRKTNPQRPLIIDVINWGNISGLASLDLPTEDKFLIASFHYYDPFPFTHQGAEWVEGSNAWNGTTWTGTVAEKNAVLTHFNIARNWSKLHKRPIFLGEFGAYSKANQSSRVNWTTFIRQSAENYEFSWAYWEFGAGFGIYDRVGNQWREDLKKALIP
jgi:endoglucanase